MAEGDTATLAQKLIPMGFVVELRPWGLEAHLPTTDYRFKLGFSPKQKLVFYQPDRHSTEKLLRNLEPHLKEMVEALGYRLAKRTGVL